MDHSSERYFLSKHAFMCMTQGYAVFLDVRKDKYSALPLAEALQVQNALAGWPIPIAPGPKEADSSSGDARLLQELREEGLITDDEMTGKAANPVTIEEPTSDLRSLMHGTPSVPRLHTKHFVSAWARITIAMRTRSLEHLIERVRQRKATSRHAESPPDLCQVRPHITSYFELQPRFFSSHNTCLRNSLTLIEYLARNDLFPTWVLGVHMEPWSAHSWVQGGSVVLNDTVERVRSFTPILAI
jgi:hypothetical protein